jgi:hypothetical protein
MDQPEIRKEIENYKMIVAHLNEHIKEGNFDNLDISQSNLLKKEIKRLKPLLTKEIKRLKPLKIKGGNINLLKAVDISKDDELYNFSNPKEAQKKAFKYIDKSAILYKSSNPKKKYMILDPNINKMVHFGQMGYEDFTKHNDFNRRDAYLKRTKNIKGNWRDNKYSANNLSRYLIWDGI